MPRSARGGNASTFTLNAAADQYEHVAELLEDEKKFIDLANSRLWFDDEHVVVG